MKSISSHRSISMSRNDLSFQNPDAGYHTGLECHALIKVLQLPRFRVILGVFLPKGWLCLTSVVIIEFIISI
uniref:USP domain-containing protein n=1 Tax=Parascaris univalens TaxID=6257 RepID=A0A914ZK90_PARUN